MLWMLPIAGAALGAMMNKKKPLQGALMGGALGAGGGLLAAPAAGAAGAAGATGAAGAGSYGAGAFGTAAGYGGTGAATIGSSAVPAAGGLLGGLKAASGYAQPAMQAMQAAQMANGLLGGNEQPQQIAPMQAQGSPALQGIVQGNEQMAAQNMQEMMKRRMSSQQLIQQMMGNRYG